jgi:hypothetical protein
MSNTWKLTENGEYRGEFAQKAHAIQAATQHLDSMTGRVALQVENTQTGEAFTVALIPKADPQQRTVTIRLRLTQAEREQVDAAAAAAGVTLSQYIRSKIL